MPVTNTLGAVAGGLTTAGSGTGTTTNPLGGLLGGLAGLDHTPR